MEILKFPHPHLSKPTQIVHDFDQDLQSWLDAMWEAMKANNGMGLSANQVFLDHRMFVMEGPGGKRLELINPIITEASIVPADLKEGCLSAPGEYLIVPSRKVWVSVAFQDVKGVAKKALFKDIYAVCAQHEIEHLDGKGFMENSSVSRKKRKELAKKWGLKVK